MTEFAPQEPAGAVLGALDLELARTLRYVSAAGRAAVSAAARDWSLGRPRAAGRDHLDAAAPGLAGRAAAVVEFAERLAVDQDRLAVLVPGTDVLAVRFYGAPDGPSPRVRLGLTGGTVWYEPRRCLVEVVLRQLATELADAGGPDPWDLGAPPAVDRGPFGWVRHVEPAPPRDHGESSRLDRALGGLAAVATVLAAAGVGVRRVVASGPAVAVTGWTAVVPGATATGGVTAGGARAWLPAGRPANRADFVAGWSAAGERLLRLDARARLAVILGRLPGGVAVPPVARLLGTGGPPTGP